MIQNRNKNWLEFEYYSINYHINKYGHKVWHQSVIPEDELYKSGYIHNFNRTRLNRLARSRESNGNSIKYADYGMDFLAYDEIKDLYYACQSKHYNCKVSSNDLGTFFDVLIFRIKQGYLYTTSQLCINLEESLETDQNKLIHHELDFKKKIIKK